MEADPSHRFGGAWTELKLDAIQYYLEFYTAALKQQPFDLWYIDAFAGSGERSEVREIGGLLEGTSIELATVQLDGSAKRAIAVSPPFKHLIFIEDDAGRFRALEELRSKDPRAECFKGDANEVLPQIFSRSEWSRTGSGKGRQRCVVFLDPYGMQAHWETLRLLRKTERADVWYLFPLGAVTRQLARDFKAVDQRKAGALDRIFGDDEWRTVLYETEQRLDLFDDVVDHTRRFATNMQIEAYFKKKLEALFPYVSEPLPIFTQVAAQQFSLFLTISNDSPKAIQLAKSGVADVLKKYGPLAFRRIPGH